MEVILYYVLTNDSAKEEKEDFYGRLLTIVQSQSRRNIIIVMSDVNTKIVSDNRGY